MMYDRNGNEIDTMTWGRLHQDYEYKVVRKSIKGDIRVSTVWLGLDQNFLGDGPPIIFETMVFGVPDEHQERYCTEAEAIAGHEKMCKRYGVK